MCENCNCEKELNVTTSDVGKDDAEYYIAFVNELSEKLNLDREERFAVLMSKLELDNKLRMAIELAGSNADEIGDIINSL
jgi:hypothetical protein